MALKKSIARPGSTAKAARNSRSAEASPAKSKAKAPAFITRLKRELRLELDELELAPKEVVATRVEGTKLYRVRIIASKFSKLGYSERQDIIWRALKNRFDERTLMQISGIRTLTPSEAESDE